VALERGPDVAAVPVRGINKLWSDLIDQGVFVPFPPEDVKEIQRLMNTVGRRAA
jgi:hypothetical protein